MHLAVLITNTDESAFAQEHPKDGQKFADLIARVRPTWKTTGFSVKDGDFPADIAEFDGLIITGSPASVHDGSGWISELLELIRQADAQRIPMFGACFGHQAIAVALGGQVEVNPHGWTFGTVEMTTKVMPDWYDGPEQFAQYAAHIEHVTRLPDDTEVIFETPDCPVAGFYRQPNIYTTQNHPEMTPDFIAALVEELADYVGPDVTAQARASLSRHADTDMFAETIAAFFEHATSEVVAKPFPINSKLRPTPAPYDAENFDTLSVTDVSKTDLSGTVIYDEVIGFDAGVYTPPSATTGPTGSGGRIKGAVQSRVVRSTTTGTLIFAFRFRDMQYQPVSGPQNTSGSNLVFIEIVNLMGFPKSAYPVEMYSIDPSQSLGAQALQGTSKGGGSFEWNTFLTDPDGSTFFEILTKSRSYKTGKFFTFDIDTRQNNGTTTRVTIDRFAIPA